MIDHAKQRIDNRLPWEFRHPRTASLLFALLYGLAMIGAMALIRIAAMVLGIW